MSPFEVILIESESDDGGAGEEEQTSNDGANLPCVLSLIRQLLIGALWTPGHTLLVDHNHNMVMSIDSHDDEGKTFFRSIK